MDAVYIVCRYGHIRDVSNRLSFRHAFYVHRDVTSLIAGRFVSHAEAAGLQEGFTHLIWLGVSKPRDRRRDRTRGRDRMGGDLGQRDGAVSFARAHAFQNVLKSFFELLAEAGVDNGV